MSPKIQKTLEVFSSKLLLQHHASSSIKTYKCILAKFLIAFNNYEIKQITLQQIHNYIEHLKTQQDLSFSYQKQILTTVKKFYLLCQNRKLESISVYKSCKLESLPKFLTKNEVYKLLSICSNKKHSCILQIIYGCGLRVSEVIRLKTEDIDRNSMKIFIRSDDGSEDRILPLPMALKFNLKNYCKEYLPKKYLFEGRDFKKYSSKSIQNFTKKYAISAKIKKHITPFTLRHSYAIHQLEKGIGVEYVQQLMGHRSIKTTEQYYQFINLSKLDIPSPLDYL